MIELIKRVTCFGYSLYFVEVKVIRGAKSNYWHTFDKRMWQRNYWEHIIRDEQSQQEIAAYITNNPAQWPTDPLNQPPIPVHNANHMRRGNPP